MNQTLTKINEDINAYLKKVEAQHQQDTSQVVQLAIQYISDQLEAVKNKFESIENISEQNEIFYFKKIKAHLLAELQYYHCIQRIESNKPAVSFTKVKRYYLNELYKIKQKINDNRFYYNYFKSNCCKLDQQFFLRLNNDFYLPNGDIIIDIDKRYITPSVYLFSNVEALEMIRIYLKKRIKTDCNPQTTTDSTRAKIKWTASKSDLIESIYALHASGVFNNGKADLKEIAEYFSEVFDIDLGQYNRVFYDIRSRKNNKTKFLDTAKEALIKRIKETDNELFP